MIINKVCEKELKQVVCSHPLMSICARATTLRVKFTGLLFGLSLLVLGDEKTNPKNKNKMSLMLVLFSE